MKSWGLTLLAVIFFTHGAQAKPLNVIIEGTDEKNSRVIREIINKKLTSPYTLDELQEVLNLIYQTGLFGDAEIDSNEVGPDKTEIIFKVSPLRIIRSIEFKGAKSFSTLDLLGELGIIEGDGYVLEKVRNGIEAVKRYYNLNGFLNSQVEGEFSPEASGLKLTVAITEGEPCLLESIKILSVNNKLNGSLEKFAKGKVNSVFTQSFLTSLQSELNNELFDDRYYGATVQNPEITYNAVKTKAQLKYVITDPYTYALVFEGNQSFTEAKIRKELNIDASNRLSNSPTDDLTERIIKFYRKNGYADVTVHVKDSLFAQDFTRRVVFTISEGYRVKISSIRFEGSFSQPEKNYSQFLFDRSGDIIYGHIYDAEDFESGLKNMITDLQNKGFIAAKVLGSRVDFSRRRDTVVITVVLDEGPQTFVSAVNFKGIKSVTAQELEDTIGLKSGAPLQLKSLEGATEKIVQLYRSKGYLDARVNSQGNSIISYWANNTKAALNFDITEGPQVTVSSIVLEGNTFTKDVVIRRELQFQPGDVLTPEKLDTSEERLRRLPFLSGIEIRTLETDAEQSARTVLVHVDERSPGLFKAGVGVNDDAPNTTLNIKGYVGAGYRNLGGTGRELTARVELDDKVNYLLEHDINLGYVEPFLFGTENTGRINLIQSRKLYSDSNELPTSLAQYNPPVTNPPYDFAFDNTQGDTLVERNLSKKLKLIYETYGIAYINYFEINNKVPAVPLQVATTGPSFVWDNRDDPFNPTRGNLSNLSLEFSSPFMGSTSTVNYYKAVLGHTQYFPLGKAVFANEGRIGYINNLSTAANSGVPALKAFRLGGDSTLRAFDPINEAIPNIIAFPAPNGIPIVPNESYFYLLKSEFRFPIIGNFGAAIFYDGGYVGLPGYSILYTPTFRWRDDVGLELLYNTPFGPVVVGYAQKLEQDQVLGEDSGRFLFSIGVF